MSFRNNNHIHEELYAVCSVESHVFKAYTSIIYSKSRTYVGFLKETRVHIKKYHFRVIMGIFRLWCLLESFI